MKLLFLIFAVGLAILITAIILNFIANKLGVMTWYDFAKDYSQAGFVDYIWLFVVYPFLLGATGYYVASGIAF